MGSRSAEGRDEYLRYFQVAVDLGDIVGEGGAGGLERWVRRELVGDEVLGQADGKGGEDKVKNKRGDGTREELEKIARETGVFLVTGCIEKAGGSLYCSAVYVCPKMGMIGKRRKVMPVSVFTVSLVVKRKLTPELPKTDRYRATSLGPRLARHPARRQHRHPRRPHQPRRRHLLGELHAHAPPVALLAEHQPLSCPDRRRP